MATGILPGRNRVNNSKTGTTGPATDPRLQAYQMGRIVGLPATAERLVAVIEACRGLLDATSLAVLLLTANRRELYFAHADEPDAVIAARLRSIRFSADLGIAGAVLRLGHGVRVANPTNDPRFYAGVDQLTGRRTRSLLCVPLLHGEAVLGVLEAVNPRRRTAFHVNDLHLLECVGHELASMVAGLGLAEEHSADGGLPRTRSKRTDDAPHCIVVTDGQCRIAYCGSLVRLRATKGLRYLNRLLRQPGIPIHVMELVGLINGNGSTASGQADHAPVPKIVEQIDHWREELREGERCNDIGRAARAQRHIERLTDELSGIFGIGDRRRRSSLAAERARSAVRQRIGQAIRAIALQHPGLGRHLRASVRTGFFCSYEPETHTIWQ